MVYGLGFESNRRYIFLVFWSTYVRYRRKKVHVRYLSSRDEFLLYSAYEFDRVTMRLNVQQTTSNGAL